MSVDRPRTPISIAPFRCNVTPPLGHALLGGLVPPAQAVDDDLAAIGYVLCGAGAPIVVCVIDWAALMNEAHLAWRQTLAAAAGTTADRVAVQCVHQHATPFICLEAKAIAAAHPDLPAMHDEAFLAACLGRAEQAVRAALQQLQSVTHVAHGQANVTAVAGNRRVARDDTGWVRAMRLSTCTDPELLALPEGTIDPVLQTVAFFSGEKKIVACHYYATHPMSTYRDGRVSSDFCGLARQRRQAEEPTCAHLYFTGCAGNIAAGKYNDGSPAARRQLTDRMYAGILASEATLKLTLLTSVDWRTDAILPPPPATPTADELAATVARPAETLATRLLAAYRLAWLRRVARGTPLILSRLRLNEISILHLPGEMFVEYQLRARAFRPADPVAVAAYGDDGLWYVPTRAEYSKGGYEVTVAFCDEKVDEIITASLQRLLA